MPASWPEDLNPAQREAVTFGDGPLLVIAGAGTGKTKTLASRVAHLIELAGPEQFEQIASSYKSHGLLPVKVWYRRPACARTGETGVSHR